MGAEPDRLYITIEKVSRKENYSRWCASLAQAEEFFRLVSPAEASPPVLLDENHTIARYYGLDEPSVTPDQPPPG